MIRISAVSLLLIGTVIISVNAAQFCSTNADCTASGCTCSDEFGPSTCMNTATLNTTLKECETCSKDGDCDALGCDTKRKVCKTCAAFSTNIASAKCGPTHVRHCLSNGGCGSPRCSCAKQSGAFIGVCGESSVYRAAVSKCETCGSDADCAEGKCQASPDSIVNRKICVSCAAPHIENTHKNCLANSNKTISDPAKTKKQTPVPCVSTAWLELNGLSDMAIRHAGAVDVLCIPGLPCGTYGHLLRDSNQMLVSYRQVCEQRMDCVASVMPVSQLSHAVDWSEFRSIDGALSLTSLSAHPNASLLSVSRFVAHLTDGLNKLGLGFVSNAVALFPYRVVNWNLLLDITGSS